MSKIRAFIAIELPLDIKIALKSLQSNLRQPGSNAVKWVDPVNLHLTLKFLGDIAPAQITTVSSAMQTASQNTRPFRLQVHTAGAFPDLKRVQVIWIDLKGDLDILLNLQKNLDSALAKLGFAPETRLFSPHLTLGRVRDAVTPLEKQIIGNSISAASLESTLTFTVSSLNLMQSQLFPSGPVYTCLKSVCF
jgi:2'-5' RNA ligase